MKKFLVSILAVFYLGLSIGVPIHQHFCMGKLIGENFSGKCSHCGMSKNTQKDCCKENYRLVKVDNDQDNGAVTYLFNQLPGIIIPGNEIFIISIAKTPVLKENLTDTPPPHSQVPLYLFDRVILI